MSDLSADNLLARLAGQGSQTGPDPWAAVAASRPRHASEKSPAASDKLEKMLFSKVGTL
jgi:hypothetical protein